MIVAEAISFPVRVPRVLLMDGSATVVRLPILSAMRRI